MLSVYSVRIQGSGRWSAEFHPCHLRPCSSSEHPPLLPRGFTRDVFSVTDSATNRAVVKISYLGGTFGLVHITGLLSAESVPVTVHMVLEADGGLLLRAAGRPPLMPSPLTSSLLLSPPSFSSHLLPSLSFSQRVFSTYEELIWNTFLIWRNWTISRY